MAPGCAPAYAELLCHSNFSFLSGASQPEELLQQAQTLGYSALALTDECSLAGVVRAHLAAKALGLPLIVGCDMQLQAPPGSAAVPDAAPSAASAAPAVAHRPGPAAATDQTWSPDADDEDEALFSGGVGPAEPTGAGWQAGPRLVLLATSRRGYGNLSQWVTVARGRAAKGRYSAWTSDLEGQVPDRPMLAGLPGCLALLHVGGVLGAPDPLALLLAQARWLQRWFGDRAALALPQLLQTHDTLFSALARQVAAATGLPIVAVGDVRMHKRSRKPLLDALTATRLKCTVAEAGLALSANAESHLRSRERLAQRFPEEWLANSVALAARCTFSLDELRYEYPREIVPAGHTPTSWLRVLTEQGALRRYPQGVPTAVRAMLEHELTLIAQLQYEAYFLTVADIVHWARGQGILCQGRGSAANSAVCYCLEVTAVDPQVHTMLLFERFISAERNEPPDIDIDFEHQRREEVIQYIYRKYGRQRAALTGVVISYRPRSALRDMGRALGFDLDRIDAVAKGQAWWDPSPAATVAPVAAGTTPTATEPPAAAPGPRRGIAPERLRENGFDPEAPLVRLWMMLTAQLIGFPRHLSQHPGGFVIARDDLSTLVPVENAAMPGRSVIQWDKDDLDALKLIKVDILALGMLSAIRRALALVGGKLGRPLALHQLPKEDRATYRMLCRGDSVGTFQVESRAQMSMLPRLKPETFYDLVVEVAIVRPGPIQGGMVHPYLRRRNGEEPVTYPSAGVKKALERTLGVPIFQEQVMQLAIYAADFTPGEADALRRAMAAWKRKGGLGPFHEKLVGRMVANGYALDYAEAIFKQIEGFGEYGFPESHAASFALLVYASAWLKCHHPDVFLVALLNSQPMGFYAPAQLVRDAREHGVEVRPVCLLHSQWDSTLEAVATDPEQVAFEAAFCGPRGAATPSSADGRRPRGLQPVRLGFSRISGFPQAAAQRLVAARALEPFSSPEDLARRAQLDAHELNLLAAANALQALSGHRHRAAWAVAGVDTRATALLRLTRTEEMATTRGPGRAVAAPPRAQPVAVGAGEEGGASGDGGGASGLGLAAPNARDHLNVGPQHHPNSHPNTSPDTNPDTFANDPPSLDPSDDLCLPVPDTAATVLADYQATGLSLVQHPVGLLRPQLAAFKVQPAAVLRHYPAGRLARASGIVTHRQRPETAKGVVFVTLEDESGSVNVIVWPAVATAQRQALLASRLLTVYGVWQAEGEVRHLVARRLVDHSALLHGLATRSRDFH
ncbi:MAG: error-prone DNA polymerase [Rubrivivax sp.]